MAMEACAILHVACSLAWDLRPLARPPRTVTVVFFTDYRPESGYTSCHAVALNYRIAMQHRAPQGHPNGGENQRGGGGETGGLVSTLHATRATCGNSRRWGQAERLAKLPFTSTSDEKHLEQLKQEMCRKCPQESTEGFF